LPLVQKFGARVDFSSNLPTKPYKAGYQRSFGFEVMRTEPDGLYDVLAASYEALLRDGHPVDSGEGM
jgi:hypothetical protein